MKMFKKHKKGAVSLNRIVFDLKPVCEGVVN